MSYNTESSCATILGLLLLASPSLVVGVEIEPKEGEVG